jgi:hypothetical protein
MNPDLDLAAAEWVKSSYSGGNGGQCLEFSRTLHPTIPIRDSKATPNGPALRFAAPDWTAFVAALKSGDLPTR